MRKKIPLFHTHRSTDSERPLLWLSFSRGAVSSNYYQSYRRDNQSSADPYVVVIRYEAGNFVVAYFVYFVSSHVHTRRGDERRGDQLKTNHSRLKKKEGHRERVAHKTPNGASGS